MSIYRKPFIGITAFIMVLFTMPLGHALMVLVEKIFGEGYQYPAATVLGFVGVGLIVIAFRKNEETPATWLGFFAGILIWTGWVEFSFVYFANHLAVAPLIENGEVVTKPEYLILPSSLGLFLATVLYFFFRRETRCNFFNWFHRNLKMELQPTDAGRKRNFAIITATETVYILWMFYILLMIVYDNRFFGDYHPATYFVFFGSLLWSLYLFIRLIKFQKTARAIRYAIPTVIIFWNAVEILGRWGFFEEIWVHPWDYTLEMGLIFAAFVGVTVLTMLTPGIQNQMEDSLGK